MLIKIRNCVIVALTIHAAFIIQTSILPALSIGQIKPNLLLIVVTSYSFMFGDRAGIFVGCYAGLVQDVFYGQLLGLSGLIYALVGYLCGKFKNLLYVEDLSFPLLMIAISDLAYGFMNYVFLFLVRNRLYLRAFLRTVVLPEMLYTVILGIVIYPLLSLLYRKVLRVRRKNPMPGILEHHSSGSD